MPELTSAAKNIIIGLMIITGAMNTLGTPLSTQHTDTRTGNWSTKEHTTNSSSTLTCRPPPCLWERHSAIYSSSSRSGEIPMPIR